MKNFIVTTSGVVLLAVPFMVAIAETSLDDAYSYESLSSFDTPVAHNHNIPKRDVNSSEMYAWEIRDTYDFDYSGPSSPERAEIAVFSEVVGIQEINLPSYTGEYGGEGE